MTHCNNPAQYVFYYTSLQSFILMFYYSLSTLGTFIDIDWLDIKLSVQSFNRCAEGVILCIIIEEFNQFIRYCPIPALPCKSYANVISN